MVERGRVTGLLAKTGLVVTTGADVATVERVRNQDDPLVAMLYVPGGSGAAIPVGAQVDLGVQSAPRQRFGVLRGRVKAVGRAPRRRRRSAASSATAGSPRSSPGRATPSRCSSSWNAPPPRPATGGPRRTGPRTPSTPPRPSPEPSTSPRSAPSIGCFRDRVARHDPPAPVHRTPAPSPGAPGRHPAPPPGTGGPQPPAPPVRPQGPYPPPRTHPHRAADGGG